MTENGQGTNYVVLKKIRERTAPDAWEQITAQYARMLAPPSDRRWRATDLRGQLHAVPSRSWGDRKVRDTASSVSSKKRKGTRSGSLLSVQWLLSAPDRS